MNRRLLAAAVTLTSAVAVLAPGQAVGAPVATPPAPTSPGLTLSAPVSVPAGTGFAVAGVLVDRSGGAVAAADVVVRSRTVGRTGWHRLAEVQTTRKGRFAVSTSATLNTEVQAFALDDAGRRVLSPVARVDARQSVVITRLDPSRPAVGQLVTVEGRTSAALRTTTVSLQRRSPTGWVTLTTTEVDDHGRFEVGTRVTDPEPLTLRVRSGARKSITRAYSARQTVSATVTATLPAGSRLAAHRQLTSVNGGYRAVMLASGALQVQRADGTVLWSSATTVHGAAAQLSADGDLVVAKDGQVGWRSRTAGAGAGAALVLQNDGSLVVFRQGTALWSSTKGLGRTVRPAECWSTTFDCISFTGYTPATRYWAMYSGHNCTNYVAYRLGLRGVTTPPWGLPGGSAWEWRAHAKAKGIRVDRTPAVGAVMQWNRNTYGGGSSGHVVYVEKVTATTVLISEDSWSGHAAVRTIRRDNPVFATARFLHVRDA